MSFLVLLMAITFLFSRISISEATSFFSFTSFDKNASFQSDDIALYGDAKLVDGGASIQLTDTVSCGVVYKKPIECNDTEANYFEGFSTVFSFSMSPGRGGGSVGFVVFPSNGTLDHSFFEVKFDISDNFTKFKDSKVTVGVYGPTVPEEITNITVVNYDKEEEILLYVWINYQANTRYLYASLTKSKGYKYDPKSEFISRIDLLEDEDEFMVGVKSYSGDFNLRSWRLQAGHFPRSIHSYAVLLESKREWEEEVEKRRREKMWGTVTCFVMTFGSIGLVFFAMMRMWAAFKRNYLVGTEECGQKKKEYEKMEKVEVVTSKAEAQQGK
ncbi:Concanavalin A-like lectin family protein [Hirschfeldia incana]|nr:Concanavalin A-like lectin family protein [Hirschfeldia incana]